MGGIQIASLQLDQPAAEPFGKLTKFIFGFALVFEPVRQF